MFALLQSILPVNENIPAAQALARRSATQVDYLSHLNIQSRSSGVRHSGIVCTIGPVSKEVDFLVDMMEAGMGIARLNFSHGTHEYHGSTIDNLREAFKKYKAEKGYDPAVAIALDTKGPEIRTGLLLGVTGFLVFFVSQQPSIIFLKG